MADRDYTRYRRNDLDYDRTRAFDRGTYQYDRNNVDRYGHGAMGVPADYGVTRGAYGYGRGGYDEGLYTDRDIYGYGGTRRDYPERYGR